ncbi:MAG: DinB family protein [Pseudomonadota bacterium]
MARYNASMNEKLYAVARSMSIADLNADRKAFFGSILGTLNHLMVGDTVWLKRFATHPAGYAALEPARSLPAPHGLDQILFSDIDSMWRQRQMLDRLIGDWSESIREDDLELPLHYASMKGIVSDRDFFGVIMHFFNHQTHHRGQLSTLLSQAGHDIGVTDLLVLVPNAPA